MSTYVQMDKQTNNLLQLLYVCIIIVKKRNGFPVIVFQAIIFYLYFIIKIHNPRRIRMSSYMHSVFVYRSHLVSSFALCIVSGHQPSKIYYIKILSYKFTTTT